MGKVVRRGRDPGSRRRRRRGRGRAEFPFAGARGGQRRHRGWVAGGQRDGTGRRAAEPAAGGGDTVNVGACRLAGPCAPLPPRGTASGPGPAGTPPPPPPRPAPGLASRDRAAPGSLPSPSPGGNNLLRRRRWRRPTRALLFQRGVWLLSRRVSPSRGGPAASAKRGRGEGRGLPSPCPVPPSPPGCLCSPPPPPSAPLSKQDGVVAAVSQAFGKPQG